MYPLILWYDDGILWYLRADPMIVSWIFSRSLDNLTGPGKGRNHSLNSSLGADADRFGPNSISRIDVYWQEVPDSEAGMPLQQLVIQILASVLL
ncbi:hypothetical protein NPIL_694051 [Nephila pilipes]|uniref:Uncharacterized protein n=1 Tax=Nephila pilipes TaxID=299642 RepID=A0A8X6TWC0_NEPPI|nr:hypothetical protein NPIL_694051 [Nephila pilipes]